MKQMSSQPSFNFTGYVCPISAGTKEALDRIKKDIKDDCLNEGHIPICIIHDKNNPVYKQVKKEIDEGSEMYPPMELGDDFFLIVSSAPFKTYEA